MSGEDDKEHNTVTAVVVVVVVGRGRKEGRRRRKNKEGGTATALSTGSSATYSHIYAMYIVPVIYVLAVTEHIAMHTCSGSFLPTRCTNATNAI